MTDIRCHYCNSKEIKMIKITNLQIIYECLKCGNKFVEGLKNSGK